jgi:hypothetical protein
MTQIVRNVPMETSTTLAQKMNSGQSNGCISSQDMNVPMKTYRFQDDFGVFWGGMAVIRHGQTAFAHATPPGHKNGSKLPWSLKTGFVIRLGVCQLLSPVACD